jgi:RHS repeat-associated protein
MTNHLGNIMVTFDDRNYDGMIDPLATGAQSEILGRQHYYSFGERGCASHTKWLVAEVKRSVCPADRHGRSRSDSEVITLHAKKHEVLMRKDMDDSYSYQHNVTVDLYQWYGIPPTGYDQQRFRYNGKELHKGSRLLDYGFRYYSAEIGRFTGVDPIADQFPHVTTYNYAENEPIGNIDLWGLQLACAKYGKVMNGHTGASKPGSVSIMIN